MHATQLARGLFACALACAHAMAQERADEDVSALDLVEVVGVTPVAGTDLAAERLPYDVQSVDSGALGEATGKALMADGIDVQQSPNSAAHILIITTRQ